MSRQVFGAEQLLKQSSAAPLSMTKVFSSLAAFSGSGGQGSYASANGVLDSWAAVNKARQLQTRYLWPLSKPAPSCTHAQPFRLGAVYRANAGFMWSL